MSKLPKLPKPTGIKVETPPVSTVAPPSSFSYTPDEKEPALGDTNPIASLLLHSFCMTLLGVISLVLGALFMFGRLPILPSIILGGFTGGLYFINITSSD